MDASTAATSAAKIIPAFAAMVLNEKVTATAALAAFGVLFGVGLVLFPAVRPNWKASRPGETP